MTCGHSMTDYKGNHNLSFNDELKLEFFKYFNFLLNEVMLTCHVSFNCPTL